MFGLEPASDLGQCEPGLCHVLIVILTHLGGVQEEATHGVQGAGVCGFVLDADPAFYRL